MAKYGFFIPPAPIRKKIIYKIHNSHILAHGVPPHITSLYELHFRARSSEYILGFVTKQMYVCIAFKQRFSG